MPIRNLGERMTSRYPISVLSLSLSFSISLLAASAAMAGQRLILGSPASFLHRLEAEEAEPGSRIALIDDQGQSLLVEITSLDREEGYFSLSGVVQGHGNSEFLIKGDAQGLFGWLALRDQGMALAYDTDAQGLLGVQAVPLSAIYPDFGSPVEADTDAPPALETPSDGASMPEGESDRTGLEYHVGAYPGTDVRKLQSLPGAPKVLWMNLNRIMTGGTPKGWTKAQVWEIWQGFAAGFSMFNVNVTTDSAVYAKAGLKNSGIANLFNETGTSFCGVGAFGSRSGCTIYRKSTPKYNAGTLIHEVGHLMGLRHDGGSGTEYFGGFKSFQWIPVMGSHSVGISWPNTLWQWSKGEYAGANQKQDDLGVMARSLGYRQDDIVGSQPLRFALGDSVTALLNRGQIARNTDADSFSFQVGKAGGKASLKAFRTEVGGGSMLDVDAAILDASGREVARGNNTASRSARLEVALPAGRYTLVIKGGAEGTAGNGFTNYSSLGFYAIEGKVQGGLSEVPSFASFASMGNPKMEDMAATLVGGSRLQLDLPAHADVKSVTLVSARGERVFTSRGSVSVIEMGGMPAGYYLLKVSLAGGTVVRKLAKL